MGADEKAWMTVEELALYLQVEESTVRQWVKKPDGIPHGKAGSLTRFNRAEIDEWLIRKRPG